MAWCPLGVHSDKPFRHQQVNASRLTAVAADPGRGCLLQSHPWMLLVLEPLALRADNAVWIKFCEARPMADYQTRMASMYLHRAIDADDLDTVSALLEKGYPLNQPSLRGYLPLSQAVIGGHAAVVRILLDHGADPNVASMALIRAVQNRAPVIIRLLLSAGARADVIDAMGRTAVDAAYETGDAALIELLRDASRG